MLVLVTASLLTFLGATVTLFWIEEVKTTTPTHGKNFDKRFLQVNFNVKRLSAQRYISAKQNGLRLVPNRINSISLPRTSLFVDAARNTNLTLKSVLESCWNNASKNQVILLF